MFSKHKDTSIYNPPAPVYILMSRHTWDIYTTNVLTICHEWTLISTHRHCQIFCPPRILLPLCCVIKGQNWMEAIDGGKWDDWVRRGRRGGRRRRRGGATNSPPKLAVGSGIPLTFLGLPYWFSKSEIWPLALVLSLHLSIGSSPFVYCLFCHAHLLIWSLVALIWQSSTDLKYSWRRLAADNSVDGGKWQVGSLLPPCCWRRQGNRRGTMDNGRLKVGGGQNYFLTKL